MTEVKPYEIFEAKDRGTVICLNVSENKHLVGLKLIGEKITANGDIYIVKEIQKFISESTSDSPAYALLTDKQ